MLVFFSCTFLKLSWDIVNNKFLNALILYITSHAFNIKTLLIFSRLTFCVIKCEKTVKNLLEYPFRAILSCGMPIYHLVHH